MQRKTLQTFAKKLRFTPPYNPVQTPNHCHHEHNTNAKSQQERRPTKAGKPKEKPNSDFIFSSAGCMTVPPGEQGCFCRVFLCKSISCYLITCPYANVGIKDMTKQDQDIWINKVQSLPNCTFYLDMAHPNIMLAAAVKTKTGEQNPIKDNCIRTTTYKLLLSFFFSCQLHIFSADWIFLLRFCNCLLKDKVSILSKAPPFLTIQSWILYQYIGT